MSVLSRAIQDHCNKCGYRSDACRDKLCAWLMKEVWEVEDKDYHSMVSSGYIKIYAEKARGD